MGEETQFWTKWRSRFRVCRMCVHTFVLILVCALLWLNQIGLPDFVKRPIIQALHQQGVELDFVRLRLNFVHGLVADNIHVGGKTPDSPSLTLQELQLELDYGKLLHRQFQLKGVVLRQGIFTLPVVASNEPTTVLTLDHIQTDLRFETNDVWSLDNFQANFAGAKFVLSGELRDAQSITNLPIFRHKKTSSSTGTQIKWEKIATALNEVHFSKGSQLSLNINGDATNLHSFLMLLTINATGAETPWCSVSNVALVAHSVASAQKPGVVADFPVEIDWKAQLSRFRSQKLNADFISCAGLWDAPNLQLKDLYVRIGKGEMHAAAKLNVNTRELSFTNSSRMDFLVFSSLLTDKTVARLDQFSLPRPPELHVNGSLILPDWLVRKPDWRTEVQPTVHLDGSLDVTNATFSGVFLNETHAHFSYSNEIWNLPEVAIARSGGLLNIEGGENDNTKDYQWHIQGALALNFIRAFLTTDKAKRGFNYFQFSEPLYLDAKINGRLYDYDSITASGHAALTNFSVRGESIDSVETDFRYAHQVAEFLQPHLLSGPQNMHADGVRLDWPGDRIYFTNGLGTANPQKVANAIGPMVASVIRPYHFTRLPTAHVNGYAPLRDSTNADLDFKVVGSAPLGWAMLKSPAVSGEIHWVGQTLTLTNFTGVFYGGDGYAHAFFDFPPHTKGATFNFDIDLQNVNLHSLATDLNSITNHLEGRVSGRFVLTSGSSLDWRSCNGYGHINLHDGLLWDVPIFGLLSPVLNAVSPGMGNSRATEASADFVMTNGVLSTDALDIRASMMRLHYDGTVDLMGNLNATVSAELLRDVPGIGPVVNFLTSPVTKILEYKITGTWKAPQSKPVYIPKFLMDMLHPLHMLEDWLPPDNQTNTPVAAPPHRSS